MTWLTDTLVSTGLLIALVLLVVYFFGAPLWPVLAMILIAFVLGLSHAVNIAFFTALAGRLFCGYACPQTVWTETFLWMSRYTTELLPKLTEETGQETGFRPIGHLHEAHPALDEAPGGEALGREVSAVLLVEPVELARRIRLAREQVVDELLEGDAAGGHLGGGGLLEVRGEDHRRPRPRRGGRPLARDPLGRRADGAPPARGPVFSETRPRAPVPAAGDVSGRCRGSEQD